MLIKVFVAWRRGALDPVGISPNQMGGIFKSILHKELATRLPEMVKAEIAAAQYEVVRGVTAGKVIEMAGVKDKRGTKGLAQIVSNILRRYHAAKGVAVKLAELGMHTAYVFDERRQGNHPRPHSRKARTDQPAARSRSLKNKLIDKEARPRAGFFCA